jgi:hypothetical protein
MSFTYQIINSIPKGNAGIVTKVRYHYEGIELEKDLEHDVPETIQEVVDLIINEGNLLLPTLQNLKNQADIITALNQMTDEQPI